MPAGGASIARGSLAFLADTGSVLGVVSGVLLVLIGAFVLSVRPRRRANVLLGALSICLGPGLALWVAEGSAPVGAPLQPTQLLSLAFAVPAAVLFVALALHLPRPLRRDERGALAAALAVAAVVGVTRWLLLLTTDGGPLVGRFGIAQIASAHLPGFVAALVLLALRHRSLPEGAPRRQCVVLSAALAPWPALVAGFNLTFLGQVGSRPELREGPMPPELAALGTVSAMLLLAALWLRNLALAPAGEGRGARLLGLGVLAGILVGYVSSLVLGGVSGAVQAGVGSVTWLLMAALLAYAILRQQLLGLDVKVKWTMKQSTVAAVFIGVFFVVSESASTFFASSVGPYLGIAAAGVLVFAMAPLQRAAERVADAAMPGVRPLEQLGPDDRARIYLDNARQAWADGTLSRDERAMLDRLRGSLGLSVEDAVRLEAEAAQATP